MRTAIVIAGLFIAKSIPNHTDYIKESSYSFATVIVILMGMDAVDFIIKTFFKSND